MRSPRPQLTREIGNDLDHASSNPENERDPWPLPSFLVVLTVYLGWLGLGWIGQTPTHEELIGYVGKMQHFLHILRSEGAFPWWLPEYLHGSSGVAMLSYVGSMPIFWLGAALFGDVTGFKIAGLACVGLGGLAAFGFATSLTSRGWAGFTIGLLFVLSPQVLLRLGWQEHLVIVAAYPFVPLVFWALLRLARHGRWVDSVLFAMAFSITLLCWTKVGASLVPPLAGFALWLFASNPAFRGHLLRGLVRVVPMIVLLAIVPNLPLLRETSFMKMYDGSPFDGWQRVYAFKTATSWMDRGGELLAALPSSLHPDRGGYYLGLVGLIAVAALIGRNWRSDRPRDQGVLPVVRAFVAIALFTFWLSRGPWTGLSGHFGILEASMKMTDWFVAPHWLGLGAQAAVIYWLIPRHRRHTVFFALALVIYFLVPATTITNRLPVFDSLRAPDSFWMLGGTFVWCVAAGVAAVHLVSLIPRPAVRLLVGGVAALIVWFDAKPYVQYFRTPGLSSQYHSDYAEALAVLSNEPQPGRVLALSGRYHYLTIPYETGHGLSTEAAHQYFTQRPMSRFQTAGWASLTSLKQALRLAGVSFVLIDRTDSKLPATITSAFGPDFVRIFESENFTLFRFGDSLAPAFVSQRSETVPIDAREAAHGLSLSPGNILALAGENLPGGESTRKVEAGPAFQKLLPIETIRGRITFDATGMAGWLALTDAWHPDWTAIVEGAPAEIKRAAGAFPAVALPTGASSVTFAFVPPWWYAVCLLVGAAAWVACCGFLAWHGIPRTRRQGLTSTAPRSK